MEVLRSLGAFFSLARFWRTPRFKLIFYVEPAALAKCKKAIFEKGAGKYPGDGNYTQCCFTVLGTGQFVPGPDAKPSVGTPGVLEEVQEVKVETLCVGRKVVRDAVEALKKYTPLEHPLPR